MSCVCVLCVLCTVCVLFEIGNPFATPWSLVLISVKSRDGQWPRPGPGLRLIWPFGFGQGQIFLGGLGHIFKLN